MKHRLLSVLRSRWSRSLLFLFMVLSLGGAAYGFKTSYIPGPVSAAQPNGEHLGGFESHASFEKECKHCHAPVRCLSANLCQDCHKEIARQRTESSGLHGLLPGTNRCENCHDEHQGRDAVISHVPFSNINHELLTGFSLNRHERNYDGTDVACQDCHPEGQFSSNSVDCSGCHEGQDPDYMGKHTERFGGNCLTCHDGQDRMMSFEHNQVFTLQGAHETAECEDCHIERTFIGVSGECAACHPEPDVHLGQFGLDCARCHSSSVWKPAQLTQHTFMLDHGGEGQVACETCHTDTYAAYTCYQCHDHEPEPMRDKHIEEGIVEFEACIDCHPTGQSGEAGGDNRDGPSARSGG